MPNHEKYMQRCLELAELGKGSVSPNPLVGAVLVHEERIIGEGWHKQYGGPHAEPHAIADVFQRYADAAQLLKASTLYVSLEPCSHQGKTPPCADLIIQHQIPKVVIACRDPFEQVNGKGIAKLEAAGIDVTTGVLQQEASFMNRRFFARVQKHRPYVILKWAETADRYFAPEGGKQQWISGKAAQILAHKWRSEEDAILVGTNTARIDNPQLNVRLWKGRNPKRVVIDKALRLPKSLHLFDGSTETLIFTALDAPWETNLKYINVENFDWYLPQHILYQLYLMDVQSLIVEGGAKTLQLFIDADLWDEARIFQSSNYWSNGIPAPLLHRAPVSKQVLGKDALLTYLNQ